MTTAQTLGLIPIAAGLALMAYDLLTLARIDRRAEDAFWADLLATVNAARADFDRDALAAMPLLDRIAHDQAPELIAETEAVLREVAAK